MPDLIAPTDPIDPRVVLALERTLLAWTRTALALMGFGFVVARLALFIREINPLAAPTAGASHWIGVVLVLVGGLVQGVAIVVHVQSVRRLRAGGALPLETYSPATLLGIGLMALAVAVALYLGMLA